MKPSKILIVDDEADLLELVKLSLSQENYELICAKNGNEAILHAQNSRPDLILLDIMLPGIDGIEVCRRLKKDQETSDIPIIMLTARHEENIMLKSFDLGAIDFIEKPFSPKILAARVRANLKKSSGPELIQIHGFEIDNELHRVLFSGNEIDLSPTEFSIFELFAKNPGVVFNRSRIIDLLRGKDKAVTDRSVDVQILGLRKKLGAQGELIETVRGIGYRLARV